MPPPVPERIVAKAAGERFYHTGKPCRNGHLSKRYTGSGLCAQCSIKNVRAHQAKTPWHPLRQAAKNAGLPRYNLGIPCASGHMADRYTSNGFCVICEDAKHKRYHAKRPGLEAKWARERRAKDPTSHRKASLKWARNNRERAAASLKKWKAANPERMRELARAGTNNRRTRIANNGGSFTADDIAALYAKQNGACAACPCDESLEIDHILPVVLGGSSNPSNLQLLCLPCNRSKGSKHPDQWLADR